MGYVCRCDGEHVTSRAGRRRVATGRSGRSTVRVGVGGPDAALTEGLPDGVQHASGVRTAEEPTVRMRPLALWTVVVSRWPTLGDHLPRERRALCARQFRELRHLFLLPSISFFR